MHRPGLALWQYGHARLLYVDRLQHRGSAIPLLRPDGGLNALFGWLIPRAALNRRELLVVYIMMIVASAIPIIGVTAQLIPFLVSVFYFTTPENNWGQVIHPYVKSWLVPGDLQAIRYFFEGVPQGAEIPWGPWLRPLLMWGFCRSGVDAPAPRWCGGPSRRTGHSVESHVWPVSRVVLLSCAQPPPPTHAR